ncbi:hypothetical protein BV898_15822 [Hypsibius exemplaris]|uniref:Receptor ligand binding region domain-containing protein n=1 Tax=Hypsibius exemplaris TaxID=2072580 RepID=A0A9X6RKY1_HYPEX|nr:hypothetical protein BV898_15822 [Hypsibius exemplaris]
MDMLAVSCTNIDGSLRNTDRFPSTVTFAMADTGPYGATVLAVMRYYLWKSIAIISDQLSGSSRANRNVEQCRAPLEQLYERRSEFEFHNFITDSSKESFTRALITATKFSRVILSCTLGEPQRRAMADAYDLEMMKGDYIFLHLYEMEVPGEPPLSWFRNDSLDVKVRAAFQHVLVVRSPPIDWKKFEEPSRLMHQRREIMFGDPITPYERNEFEVTCYEAVVTVAKVLNESYDSRDARSFSGRYMTQKMTNRTYEFPLRPITLAAGGIRSILATVQYYDAYSDTFKILLTYNSDDKVLQNISTIPDRWAQGAVIRDRPRCGMRNQYCPPSATWLTILITAVVVVACLPVTLAAGILYWHRSNQRQGAFRFWYIDHGDLERLADIAESFTTRLHDISFRLSFEN